jgi:hypothetical protein
MSAVVDFYRGTTPDYLGRSLADIWAWDHDRLESIHNYIQVLFPNREPSMFNASAPMLDDATVAAFAQDEVLRANLARSFDVMLCFYGLAYDETTDTVSRRADFPERARNWINSHNHNYLRITRILHCLRELGLDGQALAFLRCLEMIYAEHQRAIGAETLAYWRGAAGSPD